MPSFKKTQNDFSAGVVSPDFFGRDIPGAMSAMENVAVTPTGALARRPGTIRIDSAGQNGEAIIIPFGREYLLVMSTHSVRVYKNNALFQSFILNWDIDDIRRVQWVQRFDTMIFVHPDNAPRVLQKNGGTFLFSQFQFTADDDQLPFLPFMRFPETENISITPASHANGTNWAKITAAAPIWSADCVGGYMMFLNRKWQVASFVSPTELVVVTKNSIALPAAPVSDWKEAAFSARRGWPRSITFHQDRLVFGGSRDWPCGLWLSKTGQHRNFDAGTGLDDEAIFITLLSETQQKICTCISSRDLLILTDSGEWAISSAPLTPSAVNIRQHTSIGTNAERFVLPQKINGGTIFISKNEIREFALDELGENYNADDLTLTARHLVDHPESMAYDAENCRLFVVMQNGTMAVLTRVPRASISAWSVYKTAGEYLSVAVLDDRPYAIVHRANGTYLEMFSDAAANDSGEFDFSWRAESIPILINGARPKKIRVHRASARVLETRHLKIMGRDCYSGESLSGDVAANVLGGMPDAMRPLWTIESDMQSPAKILSVTIDGQYEI